MPLTPADVHNVAFSKPPIGKRGYNEDEVDAFLDLVEGELTRLLDENSDLRQRVDELDRELASGGGRAAVPTSTYAIPVAEPEPVAVAAPAIGEEQAMKAARVLSLAQDTADRLTSTARDPAEPGPGEGGRAAGRRRAQTRGDHGNGQPAAHGAGRPPRAASDLRKGIPHPAQDLPRVTAGGARSARIGGTG